MGRSTLKEHGVLKLVHPGGLIEIHTTPITANEVMIKNPKHCVARPDVFQNPWIVVRPESVLKPGSVFYIVPHHTMRKLMLKAQQNENENENGKMMNKDSKENVSISKHGSSSRGTRNGSKNARVSCDDDRSVIEYSSVDLSYFNSMKDTTPSHTSADIVLSCSDLRNSCEESGGRKERNNQVTKSSNRIMPMNNGEFQTRGYHLVELPSKEIDSPKADTFNILEKSVKDQTEDQKQSKKVDTFNIPDISKSESGLKSCLKTHMNANTTDLRVRFMLPGDEEKIMRTRLWLLDITM